jgi:DNA-binding MarR family transcriptional regulator
MDLAAVAEGMDPRKQVFGGVFVVANRVQRLLDAWLPELTTRQWWAVVMLQMLGEPPTLTQLAQAMDTSHQSVKGIVKHLEAKGFVELRPDPTDARAQRIALTPKVGAWSEATDARADAFLDAMCAGLTETELTALGRSLLAIHTALGAMEHDQKEGTV